MLPDPHSCQSWCFSLSGLKLIQVSKLVTFQTWIHFVFLLSLDSSGLLVLCMKWIRGDYHLRRAFLWIQRNRWAHPSKTGVLGVTCMCFCLLYTWARTHPTSWCTSTHIHTHPCVERMGNVQVIHYCLFCASEHCRAFSMLSRWRTRTERVNTHTQCSLEALFIAGPRCAPQTEQWLPWENKGEIERERKKEMGGERDSKRLCD